MTGPLPAPERVLPTLNADGSRRRIRPKLYPGKLYSWRLVTGWSLIALFVSLPLVRIGGHPAILLDIPQRQFHLFGKTFLPTDGVLLMLLMLSILLGIVLITAVVGRAWCGWGCPQTVYMELLFRPIERLFEGGRSEQLKLDRGGGRSGRRLLKQLVFLVLSVFVANVFLAYFVGVDALVRWVRQSPMDHPTPFLVMAGTAALVFFDFAYFREQMCTVICPYARLQSVLLDKDSVLIGYDARRGEPRTHGKPRDGKAPAGDCIDCKACVVACPTGIDIREGLQLECIACGQCIDACNTIMPRLGRAPNLIRYGSQKSLEEGTPKRLWRPRVGAYGLLLGGLLSGLVVLGALRGGAEVTLLRGLGAPYVVDEGKVRNQIRVKIVNRTDRSRSYLLELLDQGDLTLIAPENPLPVAAGGTASTSVFVMGNVDLVVGEREIRFRISDGDRFEEIHTYTLVGPRSGPLTSQQEAHLR
jgi:cytochrome c oxidase accessory protein FixG